MVQYKTQLLHFLVFFPSCHPVISSGLGELKKLCQTEEKKGFALPLLAVEKVGKREVEKKSWLVLYSSEARFRKFLSGNTSLCCLGILNA